MRFFFRISILVPHSMINFSVPDTINALFEIGGGVFILNHCRVLYRDKMVRGVSIVSTLFFALWGIWNIFYYPHLGQWLSFIGGLVITISQCIWIGMMWYYTNKETKIKLML